MHHLILNSFIFKLLETWQLWCIGVGCAGGALVVAKCVWKGLKWMGEAFYEWRKGKDEDLQRDLEMAREDQNRINTNDQIQELPPARHRPTTRR